MRVAVLTSLPRPVVIPEDFLPYYLKRAGISVIAIVAQRIPPLHVWRTQARSASGLSRSVNAIVRGVRSHVFSSPDRPARASNRIPIHYVADHNSPPCVILLRGLEPDLLILGGVGIIRQRILDIPQLGTLGCHYALLPRFRGVNVTEWAVFHDAPVGVSVFWVDSGVDTGDIVLQRQIPVVPGDTIARLRRKSADEGKALLLEAVKMIMNGTAPRVAQRVEDGKRFFTMHPRLIRLVEGKLADGRYDPLRGSGETCGV